MLPSLRLTIRLALAASCLLGALSLAGCASGGSFIVPTPIPTPNPVLTISPASLVFPATIQGLSSSPQNVTVTNTGNATLNVTNVSVTGDFTQSPSGCTGISPNSTCQIAVGFSPTAVGTRTGTLTINSNAAGGPQTVALSGTGTPAAPVLTVSVNAIQYGLVTLGQSSAPFVLTLSNTGTGVLNLTMIASSSADFPETSGTCLTRGLLSGESCQAVVTFTPSTSGARTGTLSLGSNAATSPNVTLAGTGNPAATFVGHPFQVTVQAGTKPIVGAAVQFYTAGRAGNGSAPASLVAGTFLTDSNGIVTVPAGFTCPGNSASYVVARGGQVAGTLAANGNIVLMSALGPCTSIASGASFVVNEATTVAAAEALAQFYAVGAQVGASGSNLTGLLNAFATAATLADPATGASPGSTLPSNAVSPAPRVNSLANLLNACVVSAAACPALYAATPQGSTLAANTLDAAYFLARNPTSNVAALYTLSTADSAYKPALAAAPKDWSLFITYSGGGLSSPSGIGVDSQGSVWAASYFNAASKFSPLGAPIFPSGILTGGLNNSYGLAIDPADNVWIPNELPFTSAGIGSVSEFSSAGVSLAGNGFINGGINYAISVAIDPNSTVWVVDYGNSHVTLLNSAGTPISGTTGYTTPLFAFPVAVALDAMHSGWVVNQSSNFITRVAPDGSSFTNYSCCNGASGLAIDQGDNVWVADYFGDSISLLKNDGTVVATNYTAGSSIFHPQGIAVDGAGTVWVANYRAPYLTALTGASTSTPGAPLFPTTGLGADAALLEAYALTLDASGNLWVSNQGTNTITKFIGIAVPVRTPLSGLPQLP
jgi:streptogramin lyase